MVPATNIYSRLGVKTLINAQGTVTVVGGSVMPPEVVQAMAEAAGWFVSVPELQQKVGGADRRTPRGTGRDGHRRSRVGDHGRHGRLHDLGQPAGDRSTARYHWTAQ